MVESDSLDPIFDQIANLLEIVNKNKKEAIKGKADDDLLAELDVLEMKVQFFKSVTDKALKKCGLNEASLQNEIKESASNPNTKRERMIARADLLKNRLQSLEKQYEMRAKVAKMQKKQGKATGKKRKKKFKKLGGQGWLPL